VRAQLTAMLPQEVQRHVVRTRNVYRLELGRFPYIQQARPVAFGEPIVQGGDVEPGRAGWGVGGTHDELLEAVGQNIPLGVYVER